MIIGFSINGFGYLTQCYHLCFFNKRELETTEIELKAMATEAKIGLSNNPKNGYKTPIATGIRIMLYPKAQNKFNFIVFIVFLDNLMAEATDFKSLFIRVMSAASIATSVPL